MPNDISQTTLDDCASLHGSTLLGGNSQEGGNARFVDFRIENPLLVNNSTKRAVSSIAYTQNDIKTARIWSPKQRRAYQRIMSGLKYAQFLHQRLRFMTLTTSKTAESNSLKHDFNVLVKRIRRHYGHFEYVRVKTHEGNGVLHVIYRGTFISRSWLQAQWVDIHDSWNVDIRDTQRYHCSYVVNQYLCGQTLFDRYSMTLKWIFAGFVAQWKAFKKWYPNRALELWNDFLYRYAVSVMQKSLCDYG